MEEGSSGWISHVTTLVAPQQHIPMWPGVEEIDWQALSKHIGEALNEESCTLSARAADWKGADQILEGLGERPIATPITLSPLGAPLFWIMGVEDAKFLSRVSSHGEQTFIDPEIQKSFYRYLILEGLEGVSRLSLLGDLSAKLGDKGLLNEAAYCVDVQIDFGERSVWGRLVCPQSFHAEFASHQAKLPLKPLNLEQAGKIPLSVSLRVGHTDLTYDEWRSLEVGDFLVLDHASYQPKKHKGTVQLTVHETPVMVLKVKEGRLKVFDYMLAAREESQMDPYEEGAPSDAFENDDFADFEGGPIDEEEEEVAVTPESPAEMISPKEVPLTIQVEVARLKMSLAELMQLKPGNALSLSIRPEEGVSLVLNGKVVGKGELYQLGDRVGVKITETK